MKTLASLATLALLLLCLSADAQVHYIGNVFDTNAWASGRLTSTNMPDPMTISIINATTLSLTTPLRADQVALAPGANITFATNGNGGVSITGAAGGSTCTSNCITTNLTVYGTGPPGLTVLPGAGGANSNYFGGVNVITNLISDLGTNYTSYSAGTAYTMTASPANLAFGTTTPTLIFSYPGTYLVSAMVEVKFLNSTYASSQVIQFSLVRTNGAGGTLENKIVSLTMPAMTAGTGGAMVPYGVVVFNAAAGDGIVLNGLINTTPSAGSILANSAEISAVRLH